MDLLASPLPETVEVCGEAVPIRWGWRRAVRSYSVTSKGKAATEQDVRMLLASWFSRGRDVPKAVLDHPVEALDAALAWRDRPMAEAVRYGTGLPGKPSSGLFDWEADSAIVVADFQRLYGIDLGSWQGHWWRFCALLLPLVLMEGSLVSAAMSARLPIPSDLPKEERKARERLRGAWALPLSDDELARIINARIKAEW